MVRIWRRYQLLQLLLELLHRHLPPSPPPPPLPPPRHNQICWIFCVKPFWNDKKDKNNHASSSNNKKTTAKTTTTTMMMMTWHCFIRQPWHCNWCTGTTSGQTMRTILSTRLGTKLLVANTSTWLHCGGEDHRYHHRCKNLRPNFRSRTIPNKNKNI